MITNNQKLKEQKVIAETILQQATKNQIAIVKNCIEIAYLEGVKVGLEESEKIYRDVYKPVNYDIEKCPDCGSKKLKSDSESIECMGCGSTFI